MIHACERRECPRCARKHTAKDCPLGVPHGGGDWSHTEALTIAAKLQGYVTALRIRGLRQVVVSPPPERFLKTDDHRRLIARVRRAGAKVLRELAWRGQNWGSLIVHLYRGCEAEGYDRWGPHVHAICAGVEVRKVEEYNRRTGVVVKMAAGRRGKFASYWGRRLVRHLVYELGHAAVVPDGHAVSYVGRDLIAFSPAERTTPEEPELAPKCRHGLKLSPIGYGSRPKYDPETREWIFRGSRRREWRFLDRAPAQGGPRWTRLDDRGEVVISVTPYLDHSGLPPPHYREGP